AISDKSCTAGRPGKLIATSTCSSDPIAPRNEGSSKSGPRPGCSDWPDKSDLTGPAVSLRTGSRGKIKDYSTSTSGVRCPHECCQNTTELVPTEAVGVSMTRKYLGLAGG